MRCCSLPNADFCARLVGPRWLAVRVLAIFAIAGAGLAHPSGASAEYASKSEILLAAADAPPDQATGGHGLELERAKSAFRQAPESAWLGLILLQLEVQLGLLDEAQALASELIRRFPGEPNAWAQRAYLMFTLQDYAQAQSNFKKALSFAKWTPEQRRNLTLALAESAMAGNDALAALEALEPLDGAMYFSVQMCWARAYMVIHNRHSASAAARVAAKLAVSDEEHEAADTLVELAGVPDVDQVDESELNVGYAAFSKHDDEEGLKSFQRSFARGVGRAVHYADAAYAAKRLSENKLSASLFREALLRDQDEHPFETQRAFGFRREVEVLERNWGFMIGTPYQAGGMDLLQGGPEVYWQPPKIGFRNGKILQVFVRAFENFRNGQYGQTGADTQQGSAGLRYKLLTAQNIVLTAERLFPFGAATKSDWMGRIGWSTGAGTDLSVVKPYWLTWQVFGEAAYFLQARRLLLSSEGHLGFSLPVVVGSRLTFNAYPLFSADLDNQALPNVAVAAGLGAGVRLWFREDDYRSPASFFDFNLQYRISQTERGEGIFVRVLLAY